MSDDHSRLMTTLPRMTRAQLEDVRRRAAFLLQSRSDQPGVEEEDWLLRGIVIELGRRGLDNRPFRIKKATSFANYQTQSENVRELLLQAAPGLSAVRRFALGEVAGYELAGYLRLEINRDTMLTNISRVPEAIDKAYPGYMASKLLHLVVPNA